MCTRLAGSSPKRANARTVAAAEVVEGASVRVLTAGRPISLLDVRMPEQWGAEEVAAALQQHRDRSGPLVAYVRARHDEQWAELRRDLNRAAGGQASARVMALAHFAQRCSLLSEIQQARAEQFAGEEGKGADGAIRDAAGLASVAAARLNDAYTQAEREAANRPDRPQGRAGLLEMLGHAEPAGSDDPGQSGPTERRVAGGSSVTHDETVAGWVDEDPVDDGSSLTGGS